MAFAAYVAVISSSPRRLTTFHVLFVANRNVGVGPRGRGWGPLIHKVHYTDPLPRERGAPVFVLVSASLGTFWGEEVRISANRMAGTSRLLGVSLHAELVRLLVLVTSLISRGGVWGESHAMTSDICDDSTVGVWCSYAVALLGWYATRWVIGFRGGQAIVMLLGKCGARDRGVPGEALRGSAR